MNMPLPSVAPLALVLAITWMAAAGAFMWPDRAVAPPAGSPEVNTPSGLIYGPDLSKNDDLRGLPVDIPLITDPSLREFFMARPRNYTVVDPQTYRPISADDIARQDWAFWSVVFIVPAGLAMAAAGALVLRKLSRSVHHKPFSY